MLVTFNGLNFDVPMLYRNFPKLMLDQLHLDLCPTLRRVGLRGGLKRIEQQLGLLRDPRLGRAERTRGGATLAGVPPGA
jgi:uncharacterized protein YprB with RNaseH-like and TPR domain